MFITATAYFDARFCGTSFELNYLNYFGICYNMCSIAGFIATYIFGEKWSLRFRTVFPLFWIGIIFAVCTGLVEETAMSGDTMFGVTILLVSCAGIFLSLLQVCLFIAGSLRIHQILLFFQYWHAIRAGFLGLQVCSRQSIPKL